MGWSDLLMGMSINAEASDASVNYQDPQAQRETPEVISGSEILLRSLVREGVECIFGYPGGSVLNIYDALYENTDLRHFLTRHEQGAIHAADGYARSTGKVGVCIVTSGPGATNLITGIATAHIDSVPIVVITGNVPLAMVGTDAFQEADIVGMTLPVTKHSFFVRDVKDLAHTVRAAFYIANTGRKGPVLIDIPKDISTASTTFTWPERINLRGYHVHHIVNYEQTNALLEAITRARRPLILAGAGVIHADASQELMQFAEQLQVPVTTTLLGLGGFPSHHPLWVGMPGMHGSYAANQAMQQADLIISLGARFDDRLTMALSGFAPQAEIAHIDIDKAEIGKNVPTKYPVVGDIKDILTYILPKTRSSPSPEWLSSINTWKTLQPLRYADSEDVLKPQWVIELLHRTTQGHAIITTDVGQHQFWTAQYYQFNRPRSLITSGGMGTMGFGLPSAIGAQIGAPDSLVISINGDGGIQMSSHELAVCAIHHLPIKVIVINNETLGMVRQLQETAFNQRYSHVDLSGSPDFVKLAEAYGVKGLRATTKYEAEHAWQEALTTDGPVLIEFVVPSRENVYPVVPNGKALDEMMLGDDA